MIASICRGRRGAVERALAHARRDVGAAAAGASSRCTGSSTSSSVFWPTSALPSRVSAAMPAATRARQVGGRRLGRQLLAERDQQGAEHRARRAADRRHAGHAHRLQRLVERLAVPARRAWPGSRARRAACSGRGRRRRWPGRARSARRRGRSASAWRRGSASVWSMGRSPGRASGAVSGGDAPAGGVEPERPAAARRCTSLARLDRAARRRGADQLVRRCRRGARCTRRWSLRSSMRRTVARSAAGRAVGRGVQRAGARRARRRWPRRSGAGQSPSAARGTRLMRGEPSRAATCAGLRVLVDLLRRADLHQPAVVEHADARRPASSPRSGRA